MNWCFPGRVFAVAASVVVTGCASHFTPSPAGSSPAATLFPFDLSGTCALESAKAGEEPDGKTAWMAAELSNRRLDIAAAGEVAWARPDGTRTRFAIIELADGTWVRRAGGAPEGSPLSCGVDPTRVEALATPLRATTVRLEPTAKSCRGLHLLSGRIEDVTFEPYTVLARRLYRVKAGVEAGVTLQGAEGAKLVTVPNDEFNACFAATSRTPLPEARSDALFGWILREGREASPPPPVSFDDALMALGIDEATCLREGQGPTLRRECRSAAIGVTPAQANDPGAGLGFVRERIVEALQGRGDLLIAPEDAITANVVVMPPRGASFALAKAFDAALAAAAADPGRQHRRALLGYRILRYSDASTTVTPTATLDTEVTLVASGEPQTTTESRRTTRAGAKADLPNPQYAKESARAARAQSAVSAAAVEAPRIAPLLAVAAPDCRTPGAGVVCDVGDAQRVADAPRARDQALANALAVARDALAKTLPAVPGNATETIESQVLVTHRAGEAKLRLSIVSRDPAAGTLATDATAIAFEASSAGVSVDPAHGVEVRAGGGRLTEEDYDRAAAEAIVARLDEVLATWMSRSVARVAPGALDPGSRAYQALLARHIASNRRVRLFSDVIDVRSETLGGVESHYPVQIPAGSESKCFVFVAAPADTAPLDVNLALRAESGAIVGRDRRRAPTAGFELCGLSGGAYVATVSWSRRPSNGIFLSVFESTPGAVTEADVLAASAGAPHELGKAAEPISPASPAGANK